MSYILVGAVSRRSLRTVIQGDSAGCFHHSCSCFRACGEACRSSTVGTSESLRGTFSAPLFSRAASALTPTEVCDRNSKIIFDCVDMNEAYTGWVRTKDKVVPGK